MNKLQQAVSGSSRATHAATIAIVGQMWANYEETHAQKFAENGRKQYIAVNSDGTRLAANIDLSEAQRIVAANAGATLRHEDFLVIRDRIVEIRRRMLNGVSDLEAAGLTFSADIGDQLVGFENVSGFGDAKQTQNPTGADTDNNDSVFTESYVPNPITHIGYSVPFRQTGFDYKRSVGLSESVRKCAERLEKTLFNGNSDIVINFNGTNFPIYGYTNHPSRGQGTISDWTLLANRDKIHTEINEQIGKMWASQGGVGNKSLILYVANDLWQVFQEDYIVGQPSKTILDRVKEITQLRDVKPAEFLANGQAVLVEMDARTIELAIAADIITVPHTKTNPLAPQEFTTYAAMVHQIKVDADGNTGIRHLTV